LPPTIVERLVAQQRHRAPRGLPPRFDQRQRPLR
jgi:hypothetical protein